MNRQGRCEASGYRQGQIKAVGVTYFHEHFLNVRQTVDPSNTAFKWSHPYKHTLYYTVHKGADSTFLLQL